jgi:hypothetical protein
MHVTFAFIDVCTCALLLLCTLSYEFIINIYIYIYAMCHIIHFLFGICISIDVFVFWKLLMQNH